MSDTTATTHPQRQPGVGAILRQHRVLAKLAFLIGGTIAFLLSVWLWFNGSKEQGLFVGLWVPSVFSLGALLMAGEGDGR